jgi:hypothetical protein
MQHMAWCNFMQLLSWRSNKLANHLRITGSANYLRLYLERFFFTLLKWWKKGREKSIQTKSNPPKKLVFPTKGPKCESCSLGHAISHSSNQNTYYLLRKFVLSIRDRVLPNHDVLTALMVGTVGKPLMNGVHWVCFLMFRCAVDELLNIEQICE